MAKVALKTVGCRLNQYETTMLADKLTALGLEQVSYTDKADLYILNTCTVTGRADADCRRLIARAHRQNNKAIIVVTGCYAVSQKEKISALEGVDLVIGNKDKEHLPEILAQRFPDLFRSKEGGIDTTVPAQHDEEDLSEDPLARNRALVKIGDGCNQGCSYCIVPSVRGKSVISFPANEIVDEIKHLIGEGYHEVVLTAVHIGRYSYDGLDLAGLIEYILKETNIARLRLSSLEPNEMKESILTQVAGNSRLCRHLHLPLQSGSNRILNLMCRPYRREDYLSVVERVKQANPDITVGCDLIVGFPDETEDDFRDSLDVLASGYVDYSHIFSYSDRPGTPASEYFPKVDISIIKERILRAREVVRATYEKHLCRQVGKTLGAISQQRSKQGDFFWGVSDNYIKVRLPLTAGGTKNIITFQPLRVAVDRRIGYYLEGNVID